jgi:hypothetical protein
MPRKEFEAFTRLDASDVNTFLMDQSVMTFAGTAARGSAITTPVEGMTTYLEDLDRYDSYTGSAWTPIVSTGAWTAFTPTWVNLTVGNGVYNAAHYSLVGKTVTLAIDFTFGSTTAITGTGVNIQVPADLARKSVFSTGAYYMQFYQTGLATYSAHAVPVSSDAKQFQVRYGGTTLGNLASNAPFTWTTTDRIVFGATYEVA